MCHLSRRRAPPPALKCPGGCSATAQVVQSRSCPGECSATAKVVQSAVGGPGFTGYLPRLPVLISIETHRPGAWFPGPLGPCHAWLASTRLPADFKGSLVGAGKPKEKPGRPGALLFYAFVALALLGGSKHGNSSGALKLAIHSNSNSN